MHSLRKLAASLSFLVAGAVPVSAQTFTIPNAYSFPFGDPSVSHDPKVTSNYSKRDLQTNFGVADMYLSTWSTNDPGGGSPSEVIYMFTAPADPTAMMTQGSIFYQGVADLGVGMVFDATTGDYVALVTYYDYLGINSASGQPGHMLDLYTINGPAGSPLVLSSKIQLSYAPQYGRIRMDSHIEYAVAIVWQNPGVGIETMVCNNNNWSGVTTLAGTEEEIGPDVAFSHAGGLEVNFVHQNPAAGTITKSKLNWGTLLMVPFGNTIVMPANVEDVNTGMQFPISELVIDCPDHYNVDNWAYTYTDGRKVCVRHVDYNTSGVIKTTVVNDGTLGISIANNQIPYSPTIHYGDRNITGYTGEITVGWNSSYGASSESRYLAVEMEEDGSALISAPDYMMLPNSLLSAYRNTGISFSKMSDYQHPGVPAFLYTTYITKPVFGGSNYELNHAFHKWMNGVFKGERPAMLHPECGKQSLKKQEPMVQSVIAPNPFRHSIVNSVSLKEDARVELVLLDMAGRVVGQKETGLSRGNHQVYMNGLGALPSGSYVLHTSINGKRTSAELLIKQ